MVFIGIASPAWPAGKAPRLKPSSQAWGVKSDPDLLSRVAGDSDLLQELYVARRKPQIQLDSDAAFSILQQLRPANDAMHFLDEPADFVADADFDAIFRRQ